MEIFIKAAAGVLIALVLGKSLENQSKEISVILIVAVCSMIGIAALGYLRPVINFFGTLETVGGLNAEFLSIMLRACGIGLLGELIAGICVDSGNSAMGKSLQMLSAAVILSMSVPILEELLAIIEAVLGEV